MTSMELYDAGFTHGRGRPLTQLFALIVYDDVGEEAVFAHDGKLAISRTAEGLDPLRPIADEFASATGTHITLARFERRG